MNKGDLKVKNLQEIFMEYAKGVSKKEKKQKGMVDYWEKVYALMTNNEESKEKLFWKMFDKHNHMGIGMSFIKTREAILKDDLKDISEAIGLIQVAEASNDINKLMQTTEKVFLELLDKNLFNDYIRIMNQNNWTWGEVLMQQQKYPSRRLFRIIACANQVA